jgi:hypothetical protein
MPDRRSPTSRPRRQITRTFGGRSCGPSEGGHRLHEWFWTGADAGDKGVSGHLPGVNGQVIDEFMATAAVVARLGFLRSRRAPGAATTTTASLLLVLSRQEPGIDTGAVAAGYLCVRRRDRDDQGQTGCGREERARPLPDEWPRRLGKLQLLLAAGRPRMESRSRDGPHEQSARAAPKEK